MGEIYIANGSLQGRSFHLKNDTTLIGRSPDSDIPIHDPSVSRRHARIVRSGEKYFIEDLESRNGTWVNGCALRRGERFQLQRGLPIAIGNVSISLGKRDSEALVPNQCSIDLSEDLAGDREDVLHADTIISSRRRLQQVYEATTFLMRSSDIEEICEKIMDYLFFYFERIDGGTILLVQDNSGELKEVVSRSRDEKALGVNYDLSIVTRAMHEARAVVTSNTEEGVGFSDSVETERTRSVMCLPLMSKAGTRGVIYVHATTLPQAFNREDLLFVTGLIGPAALAIENALLYSKSNQAEMALQKTRKELEEQVQKRTAELIEINRTLEELSITDGLTSLYNHRYLIRMLESEYKRSLRYKRGFALLMLDIDYFKGVNDAYGHPCGDVVLKEIARLLKDCLRTTDIVARYGGDEMAVILLETNKQMGLMVAEKLRKEIETHSFEWQGNTFHVTVSIGVAATPERGIKDWNALLNAADETLYRAKDMGRNTALAHDSHEKSV
ncbi:MAG: diguanylate cyclase [Desulfobacteraceae bacterium]|jgi:diguanylate cyclase (GGDEF)-like protein